MSRERKTIDVVGVVRFGYRKRADDFASVVEGCVQQSSKRGVYKSSGVRLRNVRVIKVVCRKGVASVVFQARAYRDGRDAVFLRNAAVFGVWEACHSDFNESDEPNEFGLHLLELDDPELRTLAIPRHCHRGICSSTFGDGHCECPCEDCITAGIHHG
jgi:hypothetical protein